MPRTCADCIPPGNYRPLVIDEQWRICHGLNSAIRPYGELTREPRNEAIEFLANREFQPPGPAALADEGRHSASRPRCDTAIG